MTKRKNLRGSASTTPAEDATFSRMAAKMKELVANKLEAEVERFPGSLSTAMQTMHLHGWEKAKANLLNAGVPEAKADEIIQDAGVRLRAMREETLIAVLLGG